nr:spore germination protein [Bacillus sp. F56]
MRLPKTVGQTVSILGRFCYWDSY